MTNLPAKRSPTDIDLGPLRLTATGVDFLKAPEFPEWQAAMQWINRATGAVQWWAGDMVVAGDSMFGEEASQEYEKETVRRWTWVCEKVPREMRRAALTFSHHEHVAKLEPREQKYWLDMAEREQLSANELKRRIKADNQCSDDADDKEPCPTCGKAGWDGVHRT